MFCCFGVSFISVNCQVGNKYFFVRVCVFLFSYDTVMIGCEYENMKDRPSISIYLGQVIYDYFLLPAPFRSMVCL